VIQERLQAVLASLATGGAYPNIAEQGVAPPYLVYQRVVSLTNNDLQGPSDLQNTRVQIDAYARTYAHAQALAQAVRAAMRAAPFTNVQISEQDFFEMDVRLHRVSLDFSIWST
jgi:hypothetical protein